METDFAFEGNSSSFSNDNMTFSLNQFPWLENESFPGTINFLFSAIFFSPGQHGFISGDNKAYMIAGNSALFLGRESIIGEESTIPHLVWTINDDKFKNCFRVYFIFEIKRLLKIGFLDDQDRSQSEIETAILPFLGDSLIQLLAALFLTSLFIFELRG